MKRILDLGLDSDTKKMVCSIINHYGTGQHPYCDDVTLNGFYITYLNKLIKKNNEKILTNLTEVGIISYNILKEKLELNK